MIYGGLLICPGDGTIPGSYDAAFSAAVLYFNPWLNTTAGVPYAEDVKFNALNPTPMPLGG